MYLKIPFDTPAPPTVCTPNARAGILQRFVIVCLVATNKKKLYPRRHTKHGATYDVGR